jgi:hypothetical protein
MTASQGLAGQCLRHRQPGRAADLRPERQKKQLCDASPAPITSAEAARNGGSARVLIVCGGAAADRQLEAHKNCGGHRHIRSQISLF